jgi:hypothetical protein
LFLSCRLRYADRDGLGVLGCAVAGADGVGELERLAGGQVIECLAAGVERPCEVVDIPAVGGKLLGEVPLSIASS